MEGLMNTLATSLLSTAERIEQSAIDHAQKLARKGTLRGIEDVATYSAYVLMLQDVCDGAGEEGLSQKLQTLQSRISTEVSSLLSSSASSVVGASYIVVDATTAMPVRPGAAVYNAYGSFGVQEGRYIDLDPSGTRVCVSTARNDEEYIDFYDPAQWELDIVRAPAVTPADAAAWMAALSDAQLAVVMNHLRAESHITMDSLDEEDVVVAREYCGAIAEWLVAGRPSMHHAVSLIPRVTTVRD